MVISVMLLSACQKVESTSADTANVAGSNTEITETTAAEPETKIEAEEKATPEPTETTKEEEADTVKSKEPAANDTDEPATEDTGDATETDDVKTEDTKTETTETASVALKDVYNRIAGSVNLPEMYFADAGFMMNYYGIDASKLEDYVFASSLDSTRADSIILIRLKDESSADEVVGGLNMVLEQMGIELESYNPEANELVKAAKVRRNGKNIDLIIHSDRNTILSIIDSSL